MRSRDTGQRNRLRKIGSAQHSFQCDEAATLYEERNSEDDAGRPGLSRWEKPGYGYGKADPTTPGFRLLRSSSKCQVASYQTNELKELATSHQSILRRR